MSPQILGDLYRLYDEADLTLQWQMKHGPLHFRFQELGQVGCVTPPRRLRVHNPSSDRIHLAREVLDFYFARMQELIEKGIVRDMEKAIVNEARDRLFSHSTTMEEPNQNSSSQTDAQRIISG